MGLADTGDPAPPKPGGDPTPAWSLCECTLTSQTDATFPADRSRQTIGVGERVRISCNRTGVKWIIHGEGTLTETTPSRATLVGGEKAGSVTVMAETIWGNGLGACTCSRTFTVVEPERIGMSIHGHTAHKQGRPTCAFLTDVFVFPETVSFAGIQVRELDDPGVGTGFYKPLDGRYHRSGTTTDGGPSPPHAVQAPASAGAASKMDGGDQVSSGDPMGPPAEGYLTFRIRWEWQMNNGNTWHPFPVDAQIHHVTPDGSCTTRKFEAHDTKALDDVDSGYQ